MQKLGSCTVGRSFSTSSAHASSHASSASSSMELLHWLSLWAPVTMAKPHGKHPFLILADLSVAFALGIFPQPPWPQGFFFSPSPLDAPGLLSDYSKLATSSHWHCWEFWARSSACLTVSPSLDGLMHPICRLPAPESVCPMWSLWSVSDRQLPPPTRHQYPGGSVGHLTCTPKRTCDTAVLRDDQDSSHQALCHCGPQSLGLFPHPHTVSSVWPSLSIGHSPLHFPCVPGNAEPSSLKDPSTFLLSLTPDFPIRTWLPQQPSQGEAVFFSFRAKT